VYAPAAPVIYIEMDGTGLPVVKAETEGRTGKIEGRSRLKRSGMFWTVRGANAIIALRCCYLNSRFEDYWESRSRSA